MCFAITFVFPLLLADDTELLVPPPVLDLALLVTVARLPAAAAHQQLHSGLRHRGVAVPANLFLSFFPLVNGAFDSNVSWYKLFSDVVSPRCCIIPLTFHGPRVRWAHCRSAATFHFINFCVVNRPRCSSRSDNEISIH